MEQTSQPTTCNLFKPVVRECLEIFHYYNFSPVPSRLVEIFPLNNRLESHVDHK